MSTSKFSHMGGMMLPEWLSIHVITQEDGSKKVEVHSTIHVNKVTKLGSTYSNEFSDLEIVNDKDITKAVAQMFCLHVPTPKWELR